MDKMIRLQLSALWLFEQPNIIFHDLDQFAMKPLLAALITGATLTSTASSDLDDGFHLIFELAALSGILWKAWTWPEARASRTL